MYGYIYKTTDLKTGKIYIGQHKSDKFVGLKYCGSGKLIRRIVNKCKANNIPLEERLQVELLEECDSLEELNEKEIYYIKLYNCHGSKGYNLNDGGAGGNHNLGRKWSAETNAKKGCRGKDHPSYGTKFTEERRHNISIGKSGKKQKPETIAKKSKSLQGKPKPAYFSEIMSEKNSGKIRTIEMKKVYAEKQRGRIWINNGEVEKHIYPEDFDSYDQTIWQKGRICKHTAWNKGLTAETCPILKETGQKVKNRRIENGSYYWKRNRDNQE